MAVGISRKARRPVKSLLQHLVAELLGIVCAGHVQTESRNLAKLEKAKEKGIPSTTLLDKIARIARLAVQADFRAMNTRVCDWGSAQLRGGLRVYSSDVPDSGQL
jgi:hypothetical protein